VSGIRCRTLAEFVHAVQNVHTLERGEVLYHAASRYTLNIGANLYARVISKLSTLSGDGWYSLPAAMTAPVRSDV
jgi:hypothetical protein